MQVNNTTEAFPLTGHSLKKLKKEPRALPPEIWQNIHYLLDIETLQQAKLVCRTWYFLGIFAEKRVQLPLIRSLINYTNVDVETQLTLLEQAKEQAYKQAEQGLKTGIIEKLKLFDSEFLQDLARSYTQKTPRGFENIFTLSAAEKMLDDAIETRKFQSAIREAAIVLKGKRCLKRMVAIAQSEFISKVTIQRNCWPSEKKYRPYLLQEISKSYRELALPKDNEKLSPLETSRRLDLLDKSFEVTKLIEYTAGHLLNRIAEDELVETSSAYQALKNPYKAGEAALLIVDADKRGKALDEVVSAHIKNKNIDDAYTAASLMPDKSFYKPDSLKEVALAYIEKDQFKKALDVICSITFHNVFEKGQAAEEFLQAFLNKKNLPMAESMFAHCEDKKSAEQRIERTREKWAREEIFEQSMAYLDSKEFEMAIKTACLIKKDAILKNQALRKIALALIENGEIDQAYQVAMLMERERNCHKQEDTLIDVVQAWVKCDQLEKAIEIFESIPECNGKDYYRNTLIQACLDKKTCLWLKNF